MKPGLIKSLIFSVILSGTGLTAAYSKEAEDIEGRQVKDEVTGIVSQLIRDIDPAAQINVSIISDTSKPKRASSPFTLNNLNTIGSKNVSMLKLTLFISAEQLPEGVKPLIEQLVADYADKLQLEVKSLPKAYVEAHKKAHQQLREKIEPTKPESIKSESIPQAKAENKSWESPLNDVLNKLLELFKLGADAKLQLEWRNASRALFIGGGIFAGILLLIALVFFFSIFMQRRIVKAIDKGFRDMAAAFEMGGGGSARLPSFADPMLNQARQIAGPMSNDATRNFSAMPDDSLLALLTDCYWTSQDRYGAFLWRRIPVEKKLKLIQRFAELASYGGFLGQIPEEDLGVEQDPAYLKPLALWNIDLEALTELVRKHPALLTKLSPLRSSALLLKPSERIALYQDAELASEPPQLNEQSIPKSPIRALKRTIRFQIKNDEDELEILGLPDPSIDIIAEVPSLGWLFKLPEDTIAEIFKPISARDLASAWIGPASILEKLGRHVGEKKLELMTSYLAKQAPSRSSIEFQSIHQTVLQELRKINPEANQGTQKNAA